MKLIILTILFSLNSFAQVAFFPVGKSGANINYAEKSKCEEVEEMPCYNVAICPTAYCDVVTETTYDEETGITIEQKVLNENAEKKAIFQAEQAAKEAAQLQAQQEKESSCEALKGLGQAIEQLESNIPSNASTVAALRAEINAKNALSANLLKNVRGCLK